MVIYILMGLMLTAFLDSLIKYAFPECFCLHFFELINFSFIFLKILHASCLILVKPSAVWSFGFCSENKFGYFVLIANSEYSLSNLVLFRFMSKIPQFSSADSLIISPILTQVTLIISKRSIAENVLEISILYSSLV